MITNQLSGTAIDEIAPSIYRISTPVDVPAVPGGFSFNQYLIVDDEPVLWHAGMRRMFPLIAEAIAAVMPVDRLRHIGFSHYEADESGALNEFLADRPGRGMADGERLSIGSRTLQYIATPHLPHGWDCGQLFDETNGVLFSGDLFTQPGARHAPVTESDILGPSEGFRNALDYYAHSRNTAAMLERLAQLNPGTLACMHGSAYRGDGAALLRALSESLARQGVA